MSTELMQDQHQLTEFVGQVNPPGYLTSTDCIYVLIP